MSYGNLRVPKIQKSKHCGSLQIYECRKSFDTIETSGEDI